ncbi:MAG: ligand-binding sensor domain-containing diguanylate cyclase [Nevskia sp.]
MKERPTRIGVSSSTSVAVRARRPIEASARLLFACFLLLFAREALALTSGKAFHNYVRDTWSIEQGLPQIGVPAIAQDGEGYIWAGTMSGLARFDGVRFTTYTPANTPALPGGLIQALRTDARGRLWIGTQKGLASYRNGKFTTIPVENPSANAEVDVQDVFVSAGGDVFVAATNGLFRVVDDKLQQDRAAPSPLFSLIERGGQRWVGGWGGVYRIENGQTEFEALPGLGLHDTVVRLAATGGRDRTSAARIWAGTTAGLFFSDGGRWQRFDGNPTLATAAIGVLYEDRDGNLWAGDQSGLARLRDGKVVELIDNDRMGTRWDYLSAFEDREGNLWLGSRTRGLTRLWNGLTTRYTSQEGLITPQVWSLARAADGRLWVGTDNGLSLLDQERFRSILPGSALPDPNVYSLLAEPDQVWLGTLHGAALYGRGQLLRLPVLAALDGLRINGIFRDSRHRLWFATSNGLFRLTDNVLTRFAETEGLRDPSVRLIYETRGGQLLLGTQYGLAEFEGERVRMLAGEGGLPPDIDVTAIHELPDGRLVVGTAIEQLFVEDAGHWVEFNHERGLPQNSAFFITHDSRGYLWVSGLRGIYRVPTEDLRWHKNPAEIGARGEMLGNELGARNTGPKGECCNGTGNSKGFIENDRIWLPTRDGVLSVPTEGITNNPVPPTVKVETANSGQGWIDTVALEMATLPASRRDISFKFTVLSFQNPYSVMLQYRLRGYDRDWRALKDPLTRYVDYTNLPPGAYTFEVRGANNAGLWNEKPAALHFRIAPFFFETVWFYLSCALLLAGAVYAGYRWQLRALTRRRVDLENLVAQRTDALAIANQQLEMASYTDPLTGLRNRRYLLNQLPQDLSFYRRKGPECFAHDHVLLFALIDIDHFKQINDRYGHCAGDLVLQQFSTLLTDLVRVGDYVTRWGGEEFLIVSRPLSRQHALAYAARICRVVSSHPFDAGTGTPLRITCSVGYSEYPLARKTPPFDWQELIELADRALYYVKDSGRDGWATFEFRDAPPSSITMQRLKNDRAGLIEDGRLEIISSFNCSGEIASLEDVAPRIADGGRSR